MARERKFDGVWNAERVLSNYLKFANEDGFLIDMNSYEESPYKINQRRFLAAMKAYGREEKAFYHPDGLCQTDSICRYIMSETRSKDFLLKILSAMKWISGSHLRNYLNLEKACSP